MASVAMTSWTGGERFTYEMQGVARSMNYYTVPEEALEAPQLMAPWARQAPWSPATSTARP